MMMNTRTSCRRKNILINQCHNEESELIGLIKFIKYSRYLCCSFKTELGITMNILTS